MEEVNTSTERWLIPELVEEDFALASDIVRRFANGRAFFTLRELRGHLTANEVQLPASHNGLQVLFEEMQETIIEQYEERDQPHRWVKQEVGRAQQYALAKVVQATPVAAPKEQPISPRARTLQEPSVAPAIVTMFRSAPNGRMRRKDVLELLREQCPSRPATDMVNEALSAGYLTRVTEHGKVFFDFHATPQPVERQSRKAAPARREALPPERPITDTEKSVAIAIMDRLTAAGTQASQGETIKMLEQALAGEVSPRDFRKLLRGLESLRLVKLSAAANYGRSRKSPKVTVRGEDVKRRYRANRDGYVARIGKLQLPR